MMAPADPRQGGVMVCPEQDCTCFGTWSVDSRAEPSEPYCGFCGSREHRAYQHPDLTYSSFEAWREAGG